MLCERKTFQRSIDTLAPRIALRECVRRALYMQRPRLHAVIAAAGFASGTSLALGAAFPPVFPLGSLYPANGGDGSSGFVLPGIDPDDFSGISVSAAGDVNGDGIDDVIVGALQASPRGDFRAGESYVVFGSTEGFPAVFPLERLYPAGGGDGSSGFVLPGIDPEDLSGISVSAAGDVNGDGIDDLLVGANEADPGGDSDAGESYVVFGSRQGFAAVFPLASLYPAGGGDGSRGFVLTGVREDDFLGRSVSAAGDVNGDGIDDIIVGALFADAGGDASAGAAYVVFGSSRGFPAVVPLASLYPAGGGDGSRGFVLTGIDVQDSAGVSVSGAGDINGDGIDDLIIGANDADPGGVSAAGESYVVFGDAQGFPAIVPLASLHRAGGGDGSRGFVIPGNEFNDKSGWCVSGAGDVNADGIDDVIIGTFSADTGREYGAGESYVVFGSTQARAIVPLASLYPAGGGDGSRGFVLTGIDHIDYSGRSVSTAGDVNADGIDDVIVGASNADGGGHISAGESYVVFGSTQGFPAVIPLASLFPAGGGDGSRGFVLTGIDRSDRSGQSVSDAGDVNGDGIDDLIIGAIQAERGGDRYTGESYVVFGRGDAP